jgi:Signal transduction histidine kinase
LDSKELNIRNEERQKIGRELHDVVAHDLLTLQFYLLEVQKNPSHESIQEALERLDYIRRQVRSLSHLYSNELSSTSKGNADLKKELKNLLIESAHYYSDLEFNFHTFPKKGAITIPIEVCLEINIVVKEVILNAMKHGEASSIEVNLTNHGDEINLMISDNGIGFDTSTIPDGIGLKNIKERMQLMGGTAFIDTKLNYGTTITLELPIKQKMRLLIVEDHIAFLEGIEEYLKKKLG